MHPLLAVDLTGIGTLILAAATACLALLTRREVQNSDENIRIARDALLAQERPELSAAPSVAANAVAPQRIVSLSNYGKTTKFVGDVPNGRQRPATDFDRRPSWLPQIAESSFALLRLPSRRKPCCFVVLRDPSML